MSNQNDKKTNDQFVRVNAELRRIVSRCREFLVECRSKLPANTNAELVPEGLVATEKRVTVGWEGP